MEKVEFFWLLHNHNLGKNQELMRCIDINLNNFNMSLLRYSRDELIDIWPSNFTASFSGSLELDYFTVDKYLDIVTTAVKNEIEKFTKNDVEFLPIKIHWIDDLPHKKSQYWVIHIRKVIDALNWEKTRWISNEYQDLHDPTILLNIIEPALRSEVIKGGNIFRIEISGKVYKRVFISYELKKSLFLAGCTKGMDFAKAYIV